MRAGPRTACVWRSYSTLFLWMTCDNASLPGTTFQTHFGRPTRATDCVLTVLGVINHAIGEYRLKGGNW